jgi:hypothetical protein
MSACKHIEEMALYLEDAKETEVPWLRWEYKESDIWDKLYRHPSWNKNATYRRKLKTININGFEVPEPLRVAPTERTSVYIVNLGSDLIGSSAWMGCLYYFLDKGLVHLTKEACEIHTKALLSFTQTVTIKD